MRPIYSGVILAILLCGIGIAPAAADTAVAFKGLRTNAALPVEITADQLQVDQTNGEATFSGNVKAVQGDMRLSTDVLVVDYVKGQKSKIDTLHAKGNVVMVTPTEAAKSETADYALSDRQLVMNGSVLLTQNGTTMSGQVLTVDLNSGVGHMTGRVKSILQPGGN